MYKPPPMSQPSQAPSHQSLKHWTHHYHEPDVHQLFSQPNSIIGPK